MLLFDQNLSHKLVDRLQDAFPNSIHVRSVKLDRSSDVAIWRYARVNKLHIVTLDRDFIDLSKRLGHPPCIVWVRTGNCTTAALEKLFRKHRIRMTIVLAKGKKSMYALS